MIYTIVVDPKVIRDIQQAIDYYDEQQVGLGGKLENALNRCLLTLERNPFFSVRYNNIRCLPLKKFPYMVHFTVDEENRLVTVRAIFNTSRDSKNWNS